MKKVAINTTGESVLLPAKVQKMFAEDVSRFATDAAQHIWKILSFQSNEMNDASKKEDSPIGQVQKKLLASQDG